MLFRSLQEGHVRFLHRIVTEAGRESPPSNASEPRLFMAQECAACVRVALEGLQDQLVQVKGKRPGRAGPEIVRRQCADTAAAVRVALWGQGAQVLRQVRVEGAVERSVDDHRVRLLVGDFGAHGRRRPQTVAL